jgi:hypothetical protein
MANQVKMVEYDAKWAYWINPKTLRLSRLKKHVPIGSIILTKSQESSEEGRVFIVTMYSIAKSDGVTRINKDKASAILTQQALDYMKQKNMWPPFTSIKDVYKNGNVDIFYVPSEYDKFILKFTEQLVDTDVQKFLASLKKSIDPSLSWIVEPAKSGRATCRTCNTKIDAGELRIGEPYLYEDHVSYKWHHPKCMSRKFITLLLSRIEGYESLSKSQRENLLRQIFSPKG